MPIVTGLYTRLEHSELTIVVLVGFFFGIVFFLGWGGGWGCLFFGFLLVMYGVKALYNKICSSENRVDVLSNNENILQRKYP